MVEKRANADLSNAPEIDLLTINEGMREQMLKERLDRAANNVNEEPLPVIVKDEKEARAVKKIDEEGFVPTKEDVQDKVEDLQEKSQDWIDSGKEKMNDWIEKGKEWKEDSKEKLGEWKEEAKNKLDEVSEQTNEQLNKLEKKWEQSWWSENYMWVFMGVVIAGTSYLMYKSFS